MTIDIPDEWIKQLLNVSPNTSIENALRYYLRTRDSSFNKVFIFKVGEYALHEMAKKI